MVTKLVLPPTRLANFQKQRIECLQVLNQRLGKLPEVQVTRGVLDPGSLKQRLDAENLAYGDYIYEVLAAYLDELIGRAFEADCEWSAGPLLHQALAVRTALLSDTGRKRYSSPLFDLADYVNSWEKAIDQSDEWGRFLENLRLLAEWQAEQTSPTGDSLAAGLPHSEIVDRLEKHIQHAKETGREGWFASKTAFCQSIGIDRSDYYRWERNADLRAPGHATLIESKIMKLPV